MHYLVPIIAIADELLGPSSQLILLHLFLDVLLLQTIFDLVINFLLFLLKLSASLC